MFEIPYTRSSFSLAGAGSVGEVSSRQKFKHASHWTAACASDASSERSCKLKMHPSTWSLTSSSCVSGLRASATRTYIRNAHALEGDAASKGSG